MITRAPRPDSNFYILDKAISEDKRLSWAARGMLVFLLGKPDHWQVSPAALTNETKGLKRGTGRDGVYTILTELKEVGYLQASGVRDASGSFAGTDYVISEVATPSPKPHTPKPHTPKPDTPKPDTAEPDTAEPRPANPPQVSIDPKQGLNGEQVLNLPAAPTAQPPGAALVVPVKPKKAKAEPAGETELQAACRATWAAYACAYANRYGAAPVRNAKVNSSVKAFVMRLGHDESPAVAAFFVDRVSEAMVIRATHDFGMLLNRCESYRTQWATGNAMTQTRARQADQTGANFSAADEAIALMRARRQAKGAANAE